MKNLIKLITLGATVAALALPVAAKNLNVATVFSVQDQCSQESKDTLYQAFRDNRTTDQQKAYDSAKKYLACPTTDVTEAQQKIIDYLKKWVTAYEIAIVYALLNDRDSAFLWLDKADHEHAVGFTFARVDPHLENLRTDPRFAQLLKRD